MGGAEGVAVAGQDGDVVAGGGADDGAEEAALAAAGDAALGVGAGVLGGARRQLFDATLLRHHLRSQDRWKREAMGQKKGDGIKGGSNKQALLQNDIHVMFFLK